MKTRLILPSKGEIANTCKVMPTHVKLGDTNIPRKKSVTKTDSRRNRKSE